MKYNFLLLLVNFTFCTNVLSVFKEITEEEFNALKESYVLFSSYPKSPRPVACEIPTEDTKLLVYCKFEGDKYCISDGSDGDIEYFCNFADSEFIDIYFYRLKCEAKNAKTEPWCVIL